MTVLVLILVLGLAAANGSNDVSKGVATLAGAGVAKLRTAVVWGAATTAVGCLVSLHFAAKLTSLFSKGIVSAKPTPAFTVAVLIGTAAWVALATWRRLPVSTTHALVGSLLGAGSVFAGDSVKWNALMVKVVEPLLLSVLVAWVVSAALAIGGTFAAGRIQAARSPRTPVGEKVLVAPGAAPEAVSEPRRTAQAAGEHRLGVVGVLHWLSSGLTSFSRGMNDTPKIVAIGSFALVSGLTPTRLLVLVTIAMFLGALVVGQKVAARLANDVIKMSHAEGFTANLTTAVMVGLGAFRGWPMSTTHVSTGAITGTAGLSMSRIQGKTIRDFAIAWVVTPPVAAAIAALAFVILR